MITIEFKKEYMKEDTQEGYVKVGDRIYGPCVYNAAKDVWSVIGTKISFPHKDIDGFSTRIWGG